MSRYALPVKPDDSSPVARIKRKMAEAHLAVGEAGGYDAALRVLLQITIGKDEHGNHLGGVSRRDQVQAAKAILKSQAETVAADKAQPEQQSLTINIGVPEILRAAEDSARKKLK